MVGVPGRSKGCHTCLKRRVKCDEARPTCKRCEKAGYACAGYERKLEMRFHTFSDQAEPATSASTKTSKDPPPTTGGVPQNLVLRSNDSPPSSSGSMPQELSFVAFRDNIQFSYLFDNFVWSSYGSPWLQMSAEGKLDALSLEACRAFSLTIFGRHHRQAEIEVNGAIHYDKTVRALSSRLSNVGAPGSENLIVPIMILLMHSSSTPDPQASAFHIQGLLKLIQICGPERFATGPLRFAFESCRATLVTVSLITRTRTFLEQPEWLSEPWAICGEYNKNPQNRLVDILVHIPGFLQDQAQLEQAPSEQFRLELIQRIEYQIAKAHNWRWQWEEMNPTVAWEVDPETLPADQLLTQPRPVRKVLVFSSFTKAAELSLYNAILLFLLGVLWTLKPPEQESPPSVRLPTTQPAGAGTGAALFLPGDVDSLVEPAVEICRAFEFQLLASKSSRDSALFWLFPLGLASKALEDNLDYLAWIKSMLDASQVTRGYGTGGNTFGFGFYRLPKIRRKCSKQRPMIQPQYDSDSVRQLSEGSSSPDAFV
ncbi:hypothetical protein, variant [Cladophialophora immunda]|uniref:Zn(2)-C6 fungal-type domain-containing protein n=1 Tax=Cladophialophora immunda TaxID=569365 RepID=A0A0D2CV28_9EURO|nr:uncharacterized protein PV07_07233 [Cladophialophora immunda]XP_016247716.1 hypothetical protein, variant [Cladophialophora immunda]KIW27499.1 hypothetical protein PV07_07233 [Cladophialophora immunda]KIW27500.1 hypothetical protein, variant [Cladophialophora immunda]OQV04168.1 Fungal Zn2-Cys6 binuclear cluster domain-containing protein [Cladophialophora immunda]